MSLEGRVLPDLPPLKVGQSLGSYVRVHLNRIEAELADGATYKSLLRALERSGLAQPTYGSLDNALCRARRQRRTAIGGANIPLSLRPAAPASTISAAPVVGRVRLTPTRELKAEDLF